MGKEFDLHVISVMVNVTHTQKKTWDSFWTHAVRPSNEM